MGDSDWGNGDVVDFVSSGKYILISKEAKLPQDR